MRLSLCSGSTGAGVALGWPRRHSRGSSRGRRLLVGNCGDRGAYQSDRWMSPTIHQWSCRMGRVGRGSDIGQILAIGQSSCPTCAPRARLNICLRPRTDVHHEPPTVEQRHARRLHRAVEMSSALPTRSLAAFWHLTAIWQQLRAVQTCDCGRSCGRQKAYNKNTNDISALAHHASDMISGADPPDRWRRRPGGCSAVVWRE
jgi:hypothetical protein